VKNLSKRLVSAVLIIVMATAITSCEPPQVYGSVGYSSYSGGGYYGGGSRYGTSVSVGGRIY